MPSNSFPYKCEYPHREERKECSFHKGRAMKFASGKRLSSARESKSRMSKRKRRMSSGFFRAGMYWIRHRRSDSGVNISRPNTFRFSKIRMVCIGNSLAYWQVRSKRLSSAACKGSIPRRHTMAVWGTLKPFGRFKSARIRSVVSRCNATERKGSLKTAVCTLAELSAERISRGVAKV